MFRKALSFAGRLLLVGAAVLATPSLSQAQRGGGHSGGAHFGGGHFSGAHLGGIHSGGYSGGIYNRGTHYGGYQNSYPYANYGYRSYYPNYGSYGYYSYPYYGFPGYYPYNYGASPYPSTDDLNYGSVTRYPDPSTFVTPQTSSYQSFYPPTTAVTPQPDTSAHVTLKVPADARIWFEGKATTSTGAIREFESPPLRPGSRYGYEIRARWTENGHEVTQTQQVAVTAGAHVNVDFPLPSEIAAPNATK